MKQIKHMNVILFNNNIFDVILFSAFKTYEIKRKQILNNDK